MKKYIALGYNNGGNPSQSGKADTLEKATLWAKDYVSKTINGKASVVEIISVVERPAPVVIVKPFEPVVEDLSVNHP